MKCQVTSSSTHDVLISMEISYKSYTEICSGEKKKVNLGYMGNRWFFKVKNNSLVHTPRDLDDYITGRYSNMPYDWEVLSKFFSIHNIEQNWLFCNYSYGICTGKVWGTEYWMLWLSQILDRTGWGRHCHWRKLLLCGRRSSSLCSGIYLSSYILVFEISF